MSVFKCKMCGGALEINNETVATCDYCGTAQTLPKTDNDVISNLFNRANNLRLKNEFDKAEQIYEKITHYRLKQPYQPRILWCALFVCIRRNAHQCHIRLYARQSLVPRRQTAPTVRATCLQPLPARLLASGHLRI